MRLAKSGHIGNVCQPNALMTFKEYLEDYASEETKKVGEAMILKELAQIPNEKVKEQAQKYIEQLVGGERDFRF